MADDEFIDPLRDPRFPNRPQSAEFWKLSEIVLKHDGAAEESEFSIIAIARQHIDDVEALEYMARQRAERLSDDPATVAMLAAYFIDGFVTGAAFAEEREGLGA